MSYKEENQLLKMIIETQSSRITEQEATIRELRSMIDELRSIKANLEETLEEFRRQFFGVRSEKTSSTPKKEGEKKTISVKGYTTTRKKKATREELYANLPIREILCKVPETESHCDLVQFTYGFLKCSYLCKRGDSYYPCQGGENPLSAGSIDLSGMQERQGWIFQKGRGIERIVSS